VSGHLNSIYHVLLIIDLELGVLIGLAITWRWRQKP